MVEEGGSSIIGNPQYQIAIPCNVYWSGLYVSLCADTVEYMKRNPNNSSQRLQELNVQTAIVLRHPV